MVVRATSDLHLTETTAPWVFAALAELRADAEQSGGVTVICGDVLDQPRSVHMPTYNELRRILASIPGGVYVIAGNHDQYDVPRNALEALDGHNVAVVSRPRESPIGLMIPYCKPELWGAGSDHILRKAPPSHIPIMWCHHGFRGAYMNAMVKDRDGVSLMEIPPGMLVVTGHYHCPQTIGRVVYCGSPYQTTFAEEGQRKGWLRWSNINENPIPVRIAYANVGAPQHWTILWHPDHGAPQIPVGVKPGDKLRIRTTATRKQAAAAAAQLERAGLAGFPVLAAPDVGREIVQGTASATPADYARSVIDQTAGRDGTPDAASMHAWASEVKLWG